MPSDSDRVARARAGERACERAGERADERRGELSEDSELSGMCIDGFSTGDIKIIFVICDELVLCMKHLV